jgi:hypothetical protein
MSCRVLRQRKIGRQSGTHSGRHFLRYLDEDPHLVHVGNAEELRPAATADTTASVDQRAHVGIARGHDAIERSDDALKCLERGQLIDLALVDIGIGERRVVTRLGAASLRLLRFGFLLGDDAFGRIAPARIGGPRELPLRVSDFDLRLRRYELGLGGIKLGVEIGGVDVREQLAFLDVCAEIEMPGLEVTVHARVNRRLIPGLDVAGQGDLLSGNALLRGNGRDDGHRQFPRPLRHLALLVPARRDAGNGDAGCDEQRYDCHQSCPARPRR